MGIERILQIIANALRKPGIAIVEVFVDFLNEKNTWTGAKGRRDQRSFAGIGLVAGRATRNLAQKLKDSYHGIPT